MPIPVDEPGASLTTTERVAAHVAQEVDQLDGADLASLEQSVEFANAVVLTYLGLTDAFDLSDPQYPAAVTVATRVAARMFKNPRDLSSYGFNDVSQGYSDPRILTPDERLLLDETNVLGFA